MHKALYIALAVSLVAGILLASAQPVTAIPSEAKLASGSEILQLVNQLRAANGLEPYRANSALMAAAQAHSDYQAATGTTSHTGKGGTRPRDRAVAYGYGGGAAVYVSENIATGTGLTAGEAVGWWQGDSIHLTTMLSSKYRDAGAGVAEADGMVYFTLDVGYVAGDEGQPPVNPPPPGSSPAAGTGATPAAIGTPIAAVVPIVAATARADGSIVHVVQSGQALWSIAAIYKVGLSYLIVLNGLSENALIYPGDKLLIRPPDPTTTPKVSATLPTTSTVTPAVTPEFTITPTLQKSPTAQAQADAAQVSVLPSTTPLSLAKALPSGQDPDQGAKEPGAVEVAGSTPPKGVDPVLAVIGVLVFLGTGLLIFGTLAGRRK